MYKVVDNAWNRENAPGLIGREYDAGEAPSYVALSWGGPSAEREYASVTRLYRR